MIVCGNDYGYFAFLDNATVQLLKNVSSDYNYTLTSDVHTHTHTHAVLTDRLAKVKREVLYGVGSIRAQLKQSVAYNGLPFLARQEVLRLLDTTESMPLGIDKLCDAPTIPMPQGFPNTQFFSTLQQAVRGEHASIDIL